MPRLVRNTTSDGSCKYGLVRMDKIRQMPKDQQTAVLQLIEKLQGAGVYEVAGKNDPEEVFCIKLKDIHAAHALFAYARSVDQYDPELAKEVFELASRSAHRKDVRHPTV
jgi:hypothetical protein